MHRYANELENKQLIMHYKKNSLKCVKNGYKLFLTLCEISSLETILAPL